MVISSSPLPATAQSHSHSQSQPNGKDGKTTSSSSSSSSPSLIPRRSKRLSGDSSVLGASPSPVQPQGQGRGPVTAPGAMEVKPKGARAKGKQLGWAASPEPLNKPPTVPVVNAVASTSFTSPPENGVGSSSDLHARIKTPGVSNALGGDSAQLSGATPSTINTPSGTTAPPTLTHTLA